MNTEQNYVGKGNHANNSEQSAKSTLLTSSVIDNGQRDSVETQYQELYGLVCDFFSYGGISHPVELLNELMLTYLHEAVGLDESVGSGKQYFISQTNLDRILNITRLSNFLVNLGETCQRIEQLKRKN